MTEQHNARVSILVVLLVVAGSLAVAGAATAQSGNSFDVGVDFPNEFAADDNQTVTVEVTNEDPTNDLVSPLIEIPLRGNIDVNASSNGSVPVIVDGERESRNSYTDDSTFRSGQALFIEGVSVPVDQTNRYEVGLDVDSPGTTDVQFDVRPLNNENNNDRGIDSEEALGFSEIDVDFDSSTNIVNITGPSTDVSRSGTFTQTVTQNLDADRSYTVETQISILDDELTVSDLSPEQANTESVWFRDVSAGEAASPIIVGHTEPSASIISPNTRTVRGTAETATKVTTTYTLETSGGNTYLIIEDSTSLSPWTGTVEFDTDNGQVTEIDQTDGVTLVNISVADDTGGSFEFIGYPVGDVDESSDVTPSDATTIAQAAADGNLGSINEYGDVTDSGDISAVDAMYIQQYLDDNRDADYTQGGN
jgi:hypothetical protein